MTKKQAETEFKSLYDYKNMDKPRKRMLWNDYVDGLIKSGRVASGKDWDQPGFIKS